MRREKDGKKIFKCWTCDEFHHYASKYPKREKSIREILSLEEIEIVCMLMRMKNMVNGIRVKVMMNQAWCLSRKMILIEKLERRKP